jgi:hypothetical protein
MRGALGDLDAAPARSQSAGVDLGEASFRIHVDSSYALAAHLRISGMNVRRFAPTGLDYVGGQGCVDPDPLLTWRSVGENALQRRYPDQPRPTVGEATPDTTSSRH